MISEREYVLELFFVVIKIGLITTFFANRLITNQCTG